MNEIPFEVSFEGRIANLSLAPSPLNALWPIFEAVTNSIQSIDELGEEAAASGYILVEFIKEKGQIIEVIITDNGVGLNDHNLGAFSKSDSRNKVKIGGKGVGRLTYLKVFNKAEIFSTFRDGANFYRRQFDFEIRDGSPLHKHHLEKIDPESAVGTGTTVRMLGYRSAYQNVVPSKPDTIVKHFIRHFISYALSESNLKIEVIIDNKTYNLYEFFRQNLVESQDASFEVKIGEENHSINVKHMILDKSLKDPEVKFHCGYFMANNRVVNRYDLDGQLGIKNINGHHVYIGLYSSPMLDDLVNQERTQFDISSKEFDNIKKQIINGVKIFLNDEIDKLKQTQAERISKLVSDHPRFMSLMRGARREDLLRRIPIYVQNEEDLYLELNRYARRDLLSAKAEYKKARKSSDHQALILEKTKQYMDFMSKEGFGLLADYMSKRKSVLDVLYDSLSYIDADEKKYELEEVIHDIICPLRSTSDDLKYDDHNLWILDDRLAYYNYFASDKTISAIVTESESRGEPDLTFFDLGIGLERKGSCEPIIIVEFKRPGRDDYGQSEKKQNPTMQILRYVNEIKTGKAVGRDGRIISHINENVSFIGYVIADITPTLKATLIGTNFQNLTPDGLGYYGYDGPSKTFIEIIPYDKLINDARIRHQIFFDKLGISN